MLIVLEETNIAPSPEHVRHAEKAGIPSAELSAWVEEGILYCASCRVWHPIIEGLPVLLPYSGGLYKEFLRRHPSGPPLPGTGFSAPSDKPAPGEEFVLHSFSREWMDYSYDDVLWTWSYEERERIFQKETGLEGPPSLPGRTYVEIGCGLGVVTHMAWKHLGGDAVGVDLSLAALRACRHFRDNPFLHFIQASLWRLPFEPASFDFIYSHGVLHHTYSTQKALASIASLCREGGSLYFWIYGTGSIREDIVRRAAWWTEAILRPLLARSPSWLADVALAPIACLYMAANALQRVAGQKRESYTFKRALHAARDRFTPMYAHRTDAAEAASWMEDLGYRDLRPVPWQEMPRGIRETFRRNVGLLGVKTASVTNPERQG